METGCSPEKEGEFKSTDVHHSQARPERVEEPKDFIYYLPLYKDVIKGDWESTKRAIDKNPSVKTAGITSFKDNPLHLAVRTGVSLQYIKNLVGLMSPSDLEILDGNRDTALHCAGIVGYTEAARILVQKNPRLTRFPGLQGKIPLQWAAKYAHKDTFWLLLSATRCEDTRLLTGDTGATILKSLIIAEFYDIAIHLLKLYPSLAIEREAEGFTALYRLALKPRAFLSGSQFGFIQGLLHQCMSHR